MLFINFWGEIRFAEKQLHFGWGCVLAQAGRWVGWYRPEEGRC